MRNKPGRRVLAPLKGGPLELAGRFWLAEHPTGPIPFPIFGMSEPGSREVTCGIDRCCLCGAPPVVLHLHLSPADLTLRIAAVTGDPRPLYTPVAFCEYHAENEDESRRRAEPLIAEHLEKRLAAGEFSPAQRGGSPGCQ